MVEASRWSASEFSLRVAVSSCSKGIPSVGYSFIVSCSALDAAIHSRLGAEDA